MLVIFFITGEKVIMKQKVQDGKDDSDRDRKSNFSKHLCTCTYKNHEYIEYMENTVDSY